MILLFPHHTMRGHNYPLEMSLHIGLSHSTSNMVEITCFISYIIHNNFTFSPFISIPNIKKPIHTHVLFINFHI